MGISSNSDQDFKNGKAKLNRSTVRAGARLGHGLLSSARVRWRAPIPLAGTGAGLYAALLASTVHCRPRERDIAEIPDSPPATPACPRAAASARTANCRRAVPESRFTKPSHMVACLGLNAADGAPNQPPFGSAGQPLLRNPVARPLIVR